MQIHELNTFSGTPGETDFIAIDSGFDTAKISARAFLKQLNDLISSQANDISILKLKKVNQPLDAYNNPTDGNQGEVLRTNGDGSTEWAAVGLPTDAQTAQAVSDWLDAHPEATTSVADHSLTYVKLVNGTLGFVTPEMYGAAGDGVTDDSTAFSNMISAGNIIFIPNKTYNLGAVVSLSNVDVMILSDGGIISGRGLTFNNSKVYIEGVTFKDAYTNAISLTDCESVINKCYFENIGTSGTLDITYQGCGVYNTGGTITFINNRCSNTHGHGSIFIHQDTDFYINNNVFVEPYYRAICLYDGANSTGEISNNYIKDTGKNLSGNSGVGCNGIYGSPATPEVIIKNNTILDAVENAIEGGFKAVIGNYINGTGVDPNKSTPSTEGIFISGSTAYVANNTVLNAGGDGIRKVAGATIQDIVIVNNYVSGSGSGYAIRLNSTTDKIVTNNLIAGNKGDGYISIVGNNSPQTNVVKDNIINTDTNSFQYIKSFGSYSEKTDYTTFGSESLGTFASNNATVTYITDDNVKVANVVYNQYGRIYKAISRVPDGYKYGIGITVKGSATIYVYSGGAYVTNSKTFASPNDFGNFYYLVGASDQKDIEIRIQGGTGETLEIKSICEYLIKVA